MSILLRIMMALFFLVSAGPRSTLGCPLEVSEDGRYVIDCLGNPVTFNADAAWHLFARLTREDTVEYLDNLSKRGFDALLVQLIVNHSGNGTTRNAYGDKPFNKPGDFASPNEAYFAHVDWAIAEALSRGFTLLIAPAYLGWHCGNQGWCQEMIAAGPANMEDWGIWVGTRYKDFGRIIWVNGGDADAESGGALDEVNAVANGILATDTVHLHTAHCKRNNSADDCYDQPWLDINTTYSDCSSTTRHLFDDYLSTPTRPNFYIEGRFEYHRDWTPQCIQGQAYAAGLGGAIGHVFGSEEIWHFPTDWRNGLDTLGYEAMTNFGRLLAARGWPYLIPDYDHNLVINGYGSIDSIDYVSAALGINRDTALVYLPTLKTVTISLASMDARFVEVTWFNPTNGNGIPGGVIPARGAHDFTPPSAQGWVLILDNQTTDWQDVWLDQTPATPQFNGQIQLFAPAPNPFNELTRVAFTAPIGARTTVMVYDAVGRNVDILFDGIGNGALQEATWHPGNRSSGVYFVRLSAARGFAIQRVVLIK